MPSSSAEYMKNRRLSRRSKLIEIKGGKCESCSNADNLHFDHRDPREKLFNLSGAKLDKPWAEIIRELDKCDLLCGECHLKKSIENKDLKGGQNKYETDHGTAHHYSTTGCRCDRCKRAKRLYRQKQIGYDQLIPL